MAFLVVLIFIFAVIYIFFGKGDSSVSATVGKKPTISVSTDSGAGAVLNSIVKEGSSALGYRLNNPLNLRYKKSNDWQGQVGSQKGFCQFSSPIYGIRAAMRSLVSYRKAGVVTVQGIINRWAPPLENNTTSYIKHVCERTSWNKDYEVRQTAKDYIKLLKAMCVSEIGSQPYSEDIWEAAAMAANLG